MGAALGVKEKDTMINLILWLVVGSLVGWLADYGIQDREGRPLTILIATIGAMIGGLLLNYNTINLLNLQNAFNLTALLTSFIGAVVLLAAVRLMRPVSVRPQ
jgi:uncharacterized membrane protein YeaQ/YmgE (transglycosylase-associated protein family)